MVPTIAIAVTVDSLALAYGDGLVRLSGTFPVDAVDALLARTDDMISNIGRTHITMCGETNATSKAIEAAIHSRGLKSSRLPGDSFGDVVEKLREHGADVRLPGPSTSYAHLGVAEAQAVAAVDFAGYLLTWCAEQIVATRAQA